MIDCAELSPQSQQTAAPPGSAIQLPRRRAALAAPAAAPHPGPACPQGREARAHAAARTTKRGRCAAADTPPPLPPCAFNRTLRAQKRELIFKEDGQEYAQVVRMLGNGRLEALCFDGKTRLGHIRGKMRKKVWVSQGDIVLCGLRDFQDQKCDIILKYSADEARNLKAYGELPAEAKINEDEQFNESEDAGCPFEFGEPDDAEEGGVDLDEI